MIRVADSLPWYALRVRPRCEKLVEEALSHKGYDVFLPEYSCRRRWSDRIKEVRLPLFSGYLFCRFDVNRRLPILTTPGVLQVVMVGKTFLPVEDHEIAAIQSIVGSQLQAEPWPFLPMGQTVRIDCGPLAGVEGVLVAAKKPCRLVVSVTLLQRSVAVEVDQAWVTAIETATGATTAPAALVGHA
jgi:transcription antitermination factor NusG